MTSRLLQRVRNRLAPVRILESGSPNLRIVQGVKLYRDVRVGEMHFRGSRDSEPRPVDYVLDAVPRGAFEGARVLDVGTAGGAVCFAAVERGARQATGVEVAAERIGGALAIQRFARVERVEFLQQDTFEYLSMRESQFDMVFVLNVLHHVANPYPLLRRIARASMRYVIVETPVQWTVGGYSPYNADLTPTDDAEPMGSLDVLERFMAVAGFRVERRLDSSTLATFHRGDESARTLAVFDRKTASTRAERWEAVQIYRTTRTRAFNVARADPHNIDLGSGESLPRRLETELGPLWNSANTNFLLAGARGSGKSFFAAQFAADRPLPYNGKIFKSPDSKGLDGRSRHLNPSSGQGNYAAEVLLGPVDDEGAHCRVGELVKALKGQPVICLLLNVPFEEHFERLYRREQSQSTGPIDYDISLRFNCSTSITALKEAGVSYRVITVLPERSSELER